MVNIWDDFGVFWTVQLYSCTVCLVLAEIVLAEIVLAEGCSSQREVAGSADVLAGLPQIQLA